MAPTEGRGLLPRVQETLGKIQVRATRPQGEARLETLENWGLWDFPSRPVTSTLAIRLPRPQTTKVTSVALASSASLPQGVPRLMSLPHGFPAGPRFPWVPTPGSPLGPLSTAVFLQSYLNNNHQEPSSWYS